MASCVCGGLGLGPGPCIFENATTAPMTVASCVCGGLGLGPGPCIFENATTAPMTAPTATSPPIIEPITFPFFDIIHLSRVV